MKPRRWMRSCHVGVPALLLFGVLGSARAAEPAAAAPDQNQARLETLRQQLAEQARRLEALKRDMAQQEAQLRELRQALGQEVLATQRGGAARDMAPQQMAQAPAPVGQSPERDSRPPEVAPIFEQPGVLTPRGKMVLEPSLQYAYSSSNRVALVGYTIIPSILIGVVDIREVKRNTFTAGLTARYGLTNRFEIEAKIPYVHRSDTSVGREILQGTATDTVFEASGNGIGDIELTGRYQFNDGGLDKPYYVGSLRLKTRTGKDPFEIQTLGSVGGLRDGVESELATGSGFYGLQPALTVLYPSDPAVFFGTVSYLYSFKRDNLTRLSDTGPVPIGTVKPGGIWGFNFGMGMALNERSSFSIGYDHSAVGKTKVNGSAAPSSVRLQLGTLLLGYSYRLNPQRVLNVSLGAGLTRDTPDVTLTVRVPITF